MVRINWNGVSILAPIVLTGVITAVSINFSVAENSKKIEENKKKLEEIQKEVSERLVEQSNVNGRVEANQAAIQQQLQEIIRTLRGG